MIDVHLSGVNSFSIQGESLQPPGLNTSTIAVHADGWSIDVCLPICREVVEGLHFNAVIPKLKELLKDQRCDESIDEGELAQYMRHVSGSDWL
jgi:hypothetical protein